MATQGLTLDRCGSGLWWVVPSHLGHKGHSHTLSLNTAMSLRREGGEGRLAPKLLFWAWREQARGQRMALGSPTEREGGHEGAGQPGHWAAPACRSTLPRNFRREAGAAGRVAEFLKRDGDGDSSSNDLALRTQLGRQCGRHYTHFFLFSDEDMGGTACSLSHRTWWLATGWGLLYETLQRRQDSPLREDLKGHFL